jgi:Zinc carboxypeptidase
MRLAMQLALLMVTLEGLSGVDANDTALRTRPELSGFTETSRAEDVARVLSALEHASSSVHVTEFGRSQEARPLPLAIVSTPAVKDAATAKRSGKPRVLVLANIHAGEVEGKEAALILARRLTLGDLRPLSSRLVVLFAPLYNADGNERVSLDHRPEQFGPLGGVGTRENAADLDLNRDFTKLEAPESRALTRLLNEWDPQVVIDLHTTNGSYHAYHLTYAPTLAVGADHRLVAFTRGLLSTATRALEVEGWRTHAYGNFTTEGQLERLQERPAMPGAGATAWRTFDCRPRFVTNGVGLRNRVAILSEAYSYLAFQRRIEVTEAFVETLLAQVARRGSEVKALVDDLDRDTIAAGGRGTLGPLGTSGRLAPFASGASPILIGDVETRINPRSGRTMTVMKETVVRQQLMQEYGHFLPIDSVIAPRAYAMAADGTSAVDRISALLTLHGVRTERVASPRTVAAEAVVPGGIARSERAVQGHEEIRLVNSRRERRTLSLPTGSLIVPMDQPLARLAFHLLEPTSDDGVVNWNFLDNWLVEGKDVPIFRITQ